LIKLCVLLTMPVASATAEMSFSVLRVWKLMLGRPWRMTGYLSLDWCIY
jgi:hypothetical protein